MAERHQSAELQEISERITRVRRELGGRAKALALADEQYRQTREEFDRVQREQHEVRAEIAAWLEELSAEPGNLRPFTSLPESDRQRWRNVLAFFSDAAADNGGGAYMQLRIETLEEPDTIVVAGSSGYYAGGEVQEGTASPDVIASKESLVGISVQVVDVNGQAGLARISANTLVSRNNYQLGAKEFAAIGRYEVARMLETIYGQRQEDPFWLPRLESESERNDNFARTLSAIAESGIHAAGYGITKADAVSDDIAREMSVSRFLRQQRQYAHWLLLLPPLTTDMQEAFQAARSIVRPELLRSVAYLTRRLLLDDLITLKRLYEGDARLSEIDDDLRQEALVDQLAWYGIESR